MDLSNPSPEHVALLIDRIKTKLKMANTEILQADDFSLDDYAELYDLYTFIDSHSSFSVGEIEGILDELGRLRKKS
ncbi:MAG: DUF1128 domain-containing protein [Candidatus Carbobacillus altaicus]|uniref:Uncharacterized protein n=1 Tax=Candidatus Carbonibacillus altaicus TaxID=2163959 RepID=A0A2R6Y3R8_9BACL|nr:DUF1128 domain-containing protein [Candidatus Carbobacillus altaicus]PTQ57298.1 MAG: hypothetical protein BSOLF_1849 [Candidatus Carbobacillus altaicus]